MDSTFVVGERGEGRVDKMRLQHSALVATGLATTSVDRHCGSHGRPGPSYHEARSTSAAASDAVAVGAVLTGARQLAAITVVASRT